MRSGDAVRDENENDQAEKQKHDLRAEQERGLLAVSYTHLTLPTTPYV